MIGISTRISILTCFFRTKSAAMNSMVFEIQANAYNSYLSNMALEIWLLYVPLAKIRNCLLAWAERDPTDAFTTRHGKRSEMV